MSAPVASVSAAHADASTTMRAPCRRRSSTARLLALTRSCTRSALLLARLQGDTEKLAIFGRTRARRGAELKVMAAVETKVPGYFTERMTIPEDDKEGFGTRTLVLKVRPPHMA